MNGYSKDRPLRAVNLGAGVESTCMVLMAAHGEITPMPDVAICADTHRERAATYENLRFLQGANVLPFPINVVTGGDLGEQIERAVRREANGDGRPPFYVYSKKRCGPAQVRRQCTHDFKIVPVEREIKRLLGLSRHARWPTEVCVEQWIGISLKEADRMKPSDRACIEIRWPLIEKKMNRRDCEAWMRGHGYPVPVKSACTFCPYRSDQEWARLRKEDPAAWEEACRMDELIRGGFRGLHGTPFIHRSLTPLRSVMLTDEDRGQANAFSNECSGVCGV